MSKKVQVAFKIPIVKRRVIAIVFVVLIVVIALLTIVFNSPERSVTAYCAVYREENMKLANAQGDTYGVSVFSHKSSNPDDFVKAFSRLEHVAPSDIRFDVATLQQVFKRLEREPSQAVNASLGGLSAEQSLKNWTNKNCLGSS